MLNKLMSVAVMVVGLSFASAAVAAPPEPAPIAEVVSAAPAPGYVWVPGHWDWHPFQGRYTWVAGYWEDARPAAVVAAPIVVRPAFVHPWYHRPAFVVRTHPVVHRVVVVHHHR